MWYYTLINSKLFKSLRASGKSACPFVVPSKGRKRGNGYGKLQQITERGGSEGFRQIKNEELEFLTDCFGIGSCNSIAAKYASVPEMEGSEWT